MEAKLAEYRAKREARQKSGCSVLYSWLFQHNSKREITSAVKETEIISSVQSPKCRQRHVPITESSKTLTRENTDRDTEIERNWKDYVQLGLKVILWLCLWKFFIEVGFGAVYFVVSCSYLMYRNTRTEPRKRGQLSAYSVFNPNQERLDGTFTAEQFEKELRMGAGSVRK